MIERKREKRTSKRTEFDGKLDGKLEDEFFNVDMAEIRGSFSVVDAAFRVGKCLVDAVVEDSGDVVAKCPAGSDDAADCVADDDVVDVADDSGERTRDNCRVSEFATTAAANPAAAPPPPPSQSTSLSVDSTLRTGERDEDEEDEGELGGRA